MGTRRTAIACFATMIALIPAWDAGTPVAADPGMQSSRTDFFALIQARRSVRSYQNRELQPGHLAEILEAARLAPSAGNLQAFEIVVVQQQENREQLARAAFGQSFVAEAPVVLVFVTDPGRSMGKYGDRGATLYSLQDAAVAATYAQLAATALGLGSVWVGAFDERDVLAAIGARQPHRAVSLLVIGYPREAPPPTSRRPLSDLARRENFAAKWSR